MEEKEGVYKIKENERKKNNLQIDLTILTESKKYQNMTYCKSHTNERNGWTKQNLEGAEIMNFRNDHQWTEENPRDLGQIKHVENFATFGRGS